MYNQQIKTSTQNIVLVGFGTEAMTMKEELLQHFPGANFQPIDRLIDRSDWFQDVENSKNTSAVICDFDQMMMDDFLFLKNLKQNLSLMKIPFILVNKNNLTLNVKELLEKGVDDCYSSPVDWEGMKTRIHFLQKYKPFILSKLNGWDEQPFQ